MTQWFVTPWTHGFPKKERIEEIVRCEECKFCMAYMAGTYCDYMAHSVEPDGFCAWAKRKKELGGLDAS